MTKNILPLLKIALLVVVVLLLIMIIGLLSSVSNQTKTSSVNVFAHAADASDADAADDHGDIKVDDQEIDDDEDDDDILNDDLFNDDDDDDEDDEDTIVELRGEADEKGSDLGTPQYIIGRPEDKDKIRQRIVEARAYIKDEVLVLDKYKDVRKICRNKNSQCGYWAAVEGECTDNPEYMQTNCAPMCFVCENMHISSRCHMDPNATDALYPGDLDRMFERIVTDPYYVQKYDPTVLSRPTYPEGEGPTNTNYQLGMWMVQLENIASPDEAQHIIKLGYKKGYKRSADVGEELEDGTYDEDVNDGRTSTNTWCQGGCYRDPVAIEVMDRMANISGIDENNAEHLQLLRYEVGQYYNSHNDYIEYQLDRPVGVRILTFFLYLNDVEEGGETRFPRIGLSVKPKTGRAVLWPSVFNDDPNKNDIRSDHEARPVIKGIKYGANAWIHQRDVKTPSGGASECL